MPRCRPWTEARLHPLAAMAGHNIQTQESYYRHIIVRYIDKPSIDLRRECEGKSEG